MSRAYDWFDENIGWDGSFLLAIICIAAIVIYHFFIMEELNAKYHDYNNSRVGGKYIINKDTLTVLTYNKIDGQYMLSNGLFVVPQFIYKSKMVK